MEYIRETGDLRDRGLRVELEAYGARVLLDWREIGGEAAAEYRALAGDLGGAGVPSVEAALAERRLRPLHDAVAILVNDGLVRDVTEALAAHLAAVASAQGATEAGARGASAPAVSPQPALPPLPAATDGLTKGGAAASDAATTGGAAAAPVPGIPAASAPPDLDALVDAWRARTLDALRAVRSVARPAVPDAELEEQAERFGARLRAALDAALVTPALDTAVDAPRAFVAAALPPHTATWGALLGWLAADAIAVVLEPNPNARVARGWFDRARLGRVFADAYRWRGLDESAAWWTVETVRHLVARPGASALVAPAGERAGRLARAWFADDDLGRWLGVNRHEGIAYLNRESFEAALRWMVVLVAVDGAAARRDDLGAVVGLAGAHALALRLASDAEAAGYEVGRLVEQATS
jgi:hypothetical protein